MDWTSGSHASTFGGNPLSCAAANAVLDVIKEQQLLDNANKQGAYAMKRLEELEETSSIVGDVRGKGLMIGVELVEDKETKKHAPSKGFSGYVAFMETRSCSCYLWCHQHLG